MKNIVLLSYGREADYRMAIFAVLSFWAWFSGKKSDVRIFLFTDKPAYFHSLLSGLPIEYEYLSSSKLKSMLGGMNYIHRRKIAVIDEIFRRYPSDDMVFLDSDTFFVSDAVPWFQSFAPEKSFMHLPEYTIEEAISHNASFNQQHYPIALIKLIESKTFKVGIKENRFYRNQVSWNSGVLGLTNESSSLMLDVFSLNDEIQRETQWYVSEQLAFSLALQTKTEILPSDQYVAHYWEQRQKVLIGKILLPLFDKDFIRLDLGDKLGVVKKLTLRFPKLMKVSKLQGHSINAFSKNYFLSGCKNALLALANSPLDFHFLKEIVFLKFSFLRKRSSHSESLRGETGDKGAKEASPTLTSYAEEAFYE